MAVREHWGTENGIHWVLDMAFAEDASRIRKDNVPHNLATLRRLNAGWDNNYWIRVITN
jgi:predicted transposase YbfD/YdcC